MKILLSLIILLVSDTSVAEDLLKGYEVASHRMVCRTERLLDGAMVDQKWEIIGKKIVIDDEPKLFVLQQQGDIFAAKATDYSNREVTVIVDFTQRKVTLKKSSGTNVLDCY